MALSFTDKLRLQGEANAIKKELKSGSLGFMAKLAKQAEWKTVIDQLKGAATSPAAEPAPAIEPKPLLDEEGTDEEAEQAAGRSLVGFRLAGVHHPKWALKFEDSNAAQASDLVVSNDQLEVCILWRPTLGTGRDAMLIGWPRYTAGTDKEGEGFNVKASRAWDGIQSPFPAGLRKKVRYMVGQAEREVARALKEGIAGFAVTMMNPPFSVRLTDSEGVYGSGRSVSNAAVSYNMERKGKGALQEAAQAGQITAALLGLNSLIAQVEYGSIDKSALPSLAEWDAVVASVPEDAMEEAHSDALTAARNNLAAALGGESQQEGPQDGAGGDLPAPEGDGSQKSSGGIVERYTAGEFKDAPYSAFRAAVVDVEKAGGTFEQIQSGAVEWVESNPELIQQAA